MQQPSSCRFPFSRDVLHASVLGFFFFESFLNGTMFLKLVLGKVGERELIFIGMGDMELCL